MKPLATLLLCLASLTSIAQSMCDCGENYKMYRSEINGVNEFYINAQDLIKILPSYGTFSPHTYTLYTGNVAISEMLTYMAGYGNVPPEFDYCDIVVDFVASSGWPATYPDAYFAIVKPSVFDETGGTFADCPLKTWWVEIVYLDGTARYWFH